jgi:tape measure domain-containing protein
MAQIIDTLVTEYRMKNQQYLQGAKQVNTATQSNASAISMAQKALGSGGSGLSGTALMAARSMVGLSAGIGAVGAAATGVLVPLALFGAAAAGIFNVALEAGKRAAPFDSMVKSLEAVEGGARAAQLAMEDLREIAKAPGIGFRESVTAYVGSRNAGMSQDFAKSIIAEIANANARGGGDIQTFERAMIAIRQIAMKQYLQGEELLQLMEAGIPVQGIIKNAFGTADTEELKKKGITSAMVLDVLNKELAKMPRVAGGAQNSLDNFYSAINMAEISFGKAASGPIFGTMDALAKEIERFEGAGVLKAIGEQVAAFLDFLPTSTGDVFVNATAAVMTFLDVMNVVKDTAIGVFNEIINFVNNSGIGKALKALFGVNFATIQAASGFNVGDRFAQNKSTIEMMLELDAKRKAKGRGRGTASASAAEGDMGANGSYDPRLETLIADAKANSDTARNTRKLVDLQQKQVDFQTALIGGGQVAEAAFSGLQVANATGGGSATSRQLVKAIDDHIAQITGKRSVVVGRGYNYNR